MVWLVDEDTYCLPSHRCCGRREKHHDRSPSATEAGMPDDDYVSEEEEEEMEREVEMMPQKGRKGAKKAAPAV